MSTSRKRSGDTQSISSAPKRTRNSQDSNSSVAIPRSNRSGKIMRVRLENFMCHSNLVVEFNERINFLVGANGSGKSAVMAALVIGLGCKASATSRSRSLKSFIKSGETSADIEIYISNDGLDRYEPETYGDFIIVSRHLSATGANTIKVKSDRGYLISKKREELEKICLYLNIQADNPVFILNQDNARSFLKDMEPSKNYKLFIKATQLDTVQETLNQCQQQQGYLSYRLECQKDEYDRYIKDKTELEKKYNDLLSLEDMKVKIEELKKEQFWVDVIEQETALNVVSKQLATYEQQAEKLSKLIDTSELQNELKATIKDLEASKTENLNQYRAQNSALNELKSELNRESEAYNDQKAEVEKLKERENRVTVNVEECEQHIREKNEIAANLNIKKQENENKIVQFKQQLADIEAMEATSKHEYNLHFSTKASFDEKKEEIDVKKRAIERQTYAIKQNIDNAKHQIKDKLAAYGQDVTNFIGALERAYKARKFSEMPRGPIGRYLEVPNELYRDRIENHIGGLLRTFIVNNANDRKVMDTIRKQQFPNMEVPIITKKFTNRLYDVSRGAVRPPEGAVLLMDEIKCSDNVVMNTLIDYKSIETILLVTRREVAERLTMDQENVPQNLSKVFLINPSLEYNPSPNYRIYSVSVGRSRLIQADPQDYIRQLQEELRQKELQIKRLQADRNGIDSQYQEVRNNIDRVRVILQNHGDSKAQIQFHIRELESIEYPTSIEMEVLNNELQELIDKRKKFQEIILAKEPMIEEKKSKVKELEAQFNAIKAEVNSLEKRDRSFKNQIDDTKVKLNEVVSNVRYNEGKLATLKASMDEAQSKIAQETESIQKLTEIALANSNGVRIESRKEKAEIKNIIDKLQRKLVQKSSGNESIEDIKQQLDAKIAAYGTTEAIVTTLTKTLENLNESRLKRYRSIHQIKRHVGIKVQNSFMRYMKNRNYKGTLSVDHKDKLLTLSVIPRDSEIEGAVSSTKSLSGGERSYSTISFLLSLWSCVDHAFYFLDEYDVFTDQVNREIMTRLLITEATSRTDRQYTFMTPQETRMAATDIITIHKLAEPQR